MRVLASILSAQGPDVPWWVFGVVVFVVAVGVWAYFRSLSKWQQPPPGRDAKARQAEAHLDALSKRNKPF